MSIILLNAGTKTRKAFMRGTQPQSVRRYQTKRMALHIDAQGTPHVLAKNKPVDFTDARVLLRLSATDAHFCGILYDFFAHANIPVTDKINRYYQGRSEKIAQMLLLALAGIPVPESYIMREESFARNKAHMLERLTFPFICKRDGRKGEHVHLIETEVMLEKYMQQKPPYTLTLFQPFIENTFDTRTIVAFGEILGTIARTRTHGFRNNVATGARVSRYELTDAEKDIALRSTQACDLDIAGVDIIHTNTGPVVLEVNKSPQVHGFESVHGFSVFERIGTLMREQVSV